MKHETVKGSSNIQSIAYDPERKAMQVTFAGGTTYEYDDVPQQKYDSFLTAAREDEASTGKHFHANFKGQHSYRKL